MRAVYRARGWEIRFVPAQEWLLPIQKRKEHKLPLLGGSRWELEIRARSLSQAFYAADLLYAARFVIEGASVEWIISGWDPYIPVPHDHRELNRLPTNLQRHLAQRRKSFYMDAIGFPEAARIACALSRRVNLRAAALKLLLSHHLFGLHHMELRPGARTAREFRALRPVHAIWFSQALFAAYGVVEELRLTPNATAQRPSLMPDGNWNQDVREDLERRLKRVGICPDERLYWHVRGRPRSIEQKGALKRIANSPLGKWSKGDIRDVEMLYIDAINISNYLRSTYAAHVGKHSALTAVEVANVQQLARMLLLHAVKFDFPRNMGRAAEAPDGL